MSQIIAFSIITLVLILIFYYLKDIFIAIAAELSTNEKSLKLEFFNFYKAVLLFAFFKIKIHKNSKQYRQRKNKQPAKHKKHKG